MKPAQRNKQVAFTITELLVVMAIIALLATISLPRLKGFGKGTGMTGAQRQLLDDLGLARLRAISSRTTVYVVFVPPTNIWNRISGETDPKVLRALTNLVSGQFTGYALVTKRTVGDQPGRESPRYVSEWKRLPDGVLIAPYEFGDQQITFPGLPPEYGTPFRKVDGSIIPFPRTGAFKPLFNLPYIAFNSQGQLSGVNQDELISLAEGSVFFRKDGAGNFQPGPPDVDIRPSNNYTNNFVRINWLTGRASVEKPGFKD